MGNQGRSRAAGAVAFCVVAAAGCSGHDPDPEPIARGLFAAGMHEPTPTLQPAVAAFVPMHTLAATPAPLGESRPLVPPPRHTVMAIGSHAQHAFDETLPRAFAAAHFGPVLSPMSCSDRDAIEWVMQGRADFAVVGGSLSVRDQRQGLQQARLGVELFALAVVESSPLRSLSGSQVRKLLTGEIRNWHELGHDGGAILVHVPSDRSRAERAAKALIPGDSLAPACLPTEDDVMPAALLAPGTLGVVRVGMPRLAGLRLLPIDWCPPTADAYALGTYPFGLAVTLVTAGPRIGAARDFLDFARSADGRFLLGRTLLVTP